MWLLQDVIFPELASRQEENALREKTFVSVPTTWTNRQIGEALECVTLTGFAGTKGEELQPRLVEDREWS